MSENASCIYPVFYSITLTSTEHEENLNMWHFRSCNLSFFFYGYKTDVDSCCCQLKYVSHCSSYRDYKTLATHFNLKWNKRKLMWPMINTKSRLDFLTTLIERKNRTYRLRMLIINCLHWSTTSNQCGKLIMSSYNSAIYIFRCVETCFCLTLSKHFWEVRQQNKLPRLAK